MKYFIVQGYWYLEQETGEFQHRIARPGEMVARHPEFLVRNVHVYHPLFAQLALSADLLILHLVAEEETAQIIQRRKKLGKATLYEIPDNFLKVGDWVPPHNALRNPMVRQRILSAARACDSLILSSPALREVFGAVSDRVQVFENQIDHFSAPRKKNDFVFGWGGSLGHGHDLAWISPAIERFCRDFPDARFAYMGDRGLFDRLFAYLDNADYTEPGSLKAYYHFIRKLSVGIAPLIDNDFNRCRSDGKFIEFAAHGVVPLLSDVACYRHHGIDGENALFFSDGESFYQHLKTLYEQPDRVARLAKQSYDYAKLKRALLNHADKRMAYYRTFLPFEPSLDEIAEIPPCTGLIAHLHKAHYLADAHEYTEALEVLDEVLEMHPTYAQAHMLRLKTLCNFGYHREVMEEYHDFACEPVYWDVLYCYLSQSALALGDARQSELVRKIADLGLRTRCSYKPSLNNERMFRKLLKINPYDYEALIRLSQITAHNPKKVEEASALFKRAVFMNPEELGAG
ncbi:glycosyltransferase [Acanthopleuribacter pedis]|uniref:Uncharacterized protein n=1 Tax=Acanthopleuribacter pedis TaxID=442870 RepID=A0A8J7QNG1_9BACT|nr:glycosyltransferase [Acanthopleuribacter pedis]MBO1322370.1 hypothetical protein [Acanthopleuribacter pedis]